MLTDICSLTYYASKDNRYYINGTKSAVKYFVYIPPNKKELVGDKTVLIKLGLEFSDYYQKNKDTIMLFNGTPWMEKNGYRKLTSSEKRIFLNALVGNVDGRSSISKFIEFVSLHYIGKKHPILNSTTYENK